MANLRKETKAKKMNWKRNLALNWKSYLVAYSVTALWILFVLPFYGLIILLAKIFSWAGDFFWGLDYRYKSLLKIVDRWLIKATKLRGRDD